MYIGKQNYNMIICAILIDHTTYVVMDYTFSMAIAWTVSEKNAVS